MKILIVTPIFPPDIGGPATYTYNLAKEFKKEHQVGIISFLNNKRISDKELIPIYVSIKNNSILRQLRLFVNILKEAPKYEIIYVQDPLVVGLAAVLIAKLLSKPCILKFVGDIVWETSQVNSKQNIKLEEFYNNREFNLNQRINIRLTRWVLNNVNQIIVPSKYLKDFLISTHHTKQDKIEVIYNGIPLFNFKKNNTKNNAITIARLVSWKKINEIIRAIVKFKELNYTIIGDGPEKTKLERLIKKLKVQNRVKIFSGLDHQKVLQELSKQEFFILNSSYEGLPHVLLEAALANTLIFTPRLSGIMEIFDEDEVIYFDSQKPDNLTIQIADYLKNRGKYMGMTNKTEQKIKEQFSWEKTVKETEKTLLKYSEKK